MKKIKKTWQKNKRVIRNLGLTGLIVGGLLFPKIARAGIIDGNVWDAHDGTSSEGTIVSCWVNNGSSGTLKDTVDALGYWTVDSGNFSSPPGIGDTVKMSGVDTVDTGTGTKVYTTHMRSIFGSQGGTDLILPTAFLDDTSKDVRAHDFGIWYVKDTSNVDDTLRAEGWLQKNPDQKIPYINYYLKSTGGDSTLVDTSDIYPQVAINLEEQDSLWQQGDSVIVRLYKTKNDTTWFSDTTFALDTMKYGCATLLDTLVFPEDSIATGLENTISGFFAYPSYEGVKLGIALDIHTTEGREEIKIQKRKAKRANWRNGSDARNGNYRDLTSIVAEHPVVSYLDKDVEKGKGYDYRAIFNKDTLYASVFVPNSFFKVWPTITTGKIHVKGAKEFVVYDLSGRKVKTYGKNANSTGANSTSSGVYNFDLPQGVYFLKPKDKGSGSNVKETKKVVKVK